MKQEPLVVLKKDSNHFTFKNNRKGTIPMSDEEAQTNDLGKALMARLNHPVIGLFIGSWVVWNWEVIYWLLCGIKDPQNTFSILTTQYLIPTRLHDLVVVPLLATLVYVIFGPFLIELNMLYKDLLKTIREFFSARIAKLEPVPKYQVDTLKTQLDHLQQEKRVLEDFYMYSSTKKIKGFRNEEVDVRQLISTNLQQNKKAQEDQQKIVELEAALLMEKNKK